MKENGNAIAHQVGLSRQIGRWSWLAYLVVALPAVCLLTMTWVGVLLLKEVSSDYGPVESALPNLLEQSVGFLAVIGLPVMWLLGVLLAHRFEDPRFRFVPFLANLIPALAFLWFSIELSLEGDQESWWLISHAGVLVLLLLAGMAAVLIDRGRSGLP